ncbi:MAG: PhzF family phenazine biosynthesis protein [Terracidiphilus sp.]|jgi:trans-2,3-dihydro-3-hydroxyanthranilate isomerase
MPRIDYFVVDVFTQSALAGNPLAVVMNTCSLTTERMQAIAREFNLSETTFIERRDSAIELTEGVRVRIFTTQEELNFAGHPTLGTASILRMAAPECVAPEAGTSGKVTLALNVGAVPVRFSGEESYGEMTQHDPEFGAVLEAGQVARLIGLDTEDLEPSLSPQVVSTGTAFAIVVLRTDAALARLQVNQSAATRWLRECGARWFYVLGPVSQSQDGEESIWRARLQFYGGEDPATGSAAGCAISYLVHHGAVASGERTHLRQGAEIGRPSDLFLSAQLDHGDSRRDSSRVRDVRVGGSTVLVAKGQLFLP